MEMLELRKIERELLKNRDYVARMDTSDYGQGAVDAYDIALAMVRATLELSNQNA